MASKRRGNIDSVVEGFGAIRQDYNANRESRFRRRRTGVISSGSGADFHYKSQADYLRLIEQARDMDRNDSMVGSTIDRARDNIIQEGFKLDPQTGDEKLSKDLFDRWVDWSEDADQCDIMGEHDFYTMEQLIPREVSVDGDIFALPMKTGELQIMEAHRARTPQGTRRNVVHGVLLNDVRKRLEYWFTKDDIDPRQQIKLVGEMSPIAARDSDGNRQVFHIYSPKRMTQTRGITALAPIFDVLGMFEDIQFAKLIQQQVVSCFAIFREREIDFKPGNAGDDKRGAEETETLNDGESRVITGIAPGMEVQGKAGEKLHGFSPNVPNAEFFDHVKLILTQIGINLGLPLILVTLDAT